MSTDNEIDPLAILQERQRLREEESLQQQVVAAAEAIIEAQQADELQAMVPQLVEEFLNESSTLYNLYRTHDYPHLNDAYIVNVIDHEAIAERAAQKSAKPSWLRRLLSPHLWAPTPTPQPTRPLACWPVAWINLEGRRPLATVYLEVTKGRLYSNSFEGRRFSDTLDVQQLYQLSYKEILLLITRTQDKISWIQSGIESERYFGHGTSE